MRILVTGAGGFIGGHLCPALDAAGHEVLRLDSEGGGVLNVALLHNAMKDQDAVIHLAAMSSIKECEANLAECARLNRGGLLNVLVEAELCGLHRVVFASSSAVYGIGGPPMSHPYARSKAAGEKWCGYFADLGLPIVVLRLFNVYGPGGHGVVDRFLAAAARGEPLAIAGDGTQTRDFVHVDDVVRAFIAALEAPAGTYDVGTGLARQIRQVAEEIGSSGGLLTGCGDPGAPVSCADPGKFLPGWEPHEGSGPCTVNREPCTGKEAA